MQMTPEHPSRRWIGTLPAAALAAALTLAPGASASKLDPLTDRNLPPRLEQLATPPLSRDGNRVLGYVHFERGAVAALDALRAAGARIVEASRRYQTVTVAAKPGDLGELGDLARVDGVTPVRRPIVAGVGGSASSASPVTPCFGAATSEGDLQLKAMAARDGFEVDGSGVKVGILSDSFNRDTAADTRESTDVASGDLPGPGSPCGSTSPVQVLDDSEAGEDEGRAMAQIVHDLAPGAEIAFATAFDDELTFAKNIGELVKAGAKVIVDDVFYPEEPFFQDGPVAVAVNEAVKAGVTYLSAAGNDNLIDGKGRNIASWEAPEFRDSKSCPAPLVALSEEIEEAEGPGNGLEPDHCMDFDPGPEPSESDDTFGLTVSGGATLVADLQWAEPREGVESDLDAFLFSAAGQPLRISIDPNTGPTKPQQPLEVLEWRNNSGAPAQVNLMINRFSGANSTPLKFALLQNGGGVTATEYPESAEGDTVGPTIFGHSGAASAIGVGAAPYFDDEAPEDYSSQGPLTHYFGPVAGTTPAEPLLTPEVIAKPDVTATDGGANTFFGSCVSHTWRFFGTSAAAPHAAAVAALELQKEPGASVEEVRQALTDSAAPIGKFPPEAVGTGLVEAPEAIAAVSSTPFPGGTQFAQLTPQNCNLPSPPGPTPTSPTPTPVPSATVPRPPRTFFRLRPPRVVRTHRRSAPVTFSFGSSDSEASFACRIDGGLFRPCPATLRRRFGVGWHTLRVVARDASGSDPTPASYRFQVKRVG